MAETTYSLINNFSRVFAYVQSLRRTEARVQPGYQEVKSRISSLLEDCAAMARKGSADPRDFDNARFAVCTWIDETIMGMPWNAREEWRRNLLQVELYGITNGGEEFFERMDSLTPEQNNVREVYFFCLGLGFAGRYCNPGDEILLSQLKKAAQRQLTKGNTVTADYKNKPMFESAYKGLGELAGPSNAKQQRWTATKLVFLVAPPVVLGIIYVVYLFVLNGIGTNVVARLAGGM